MNAIQIILTIAFIALFIYQSIKLVDVIKKRLEKKKLIKERKSELIDKNEPIDLDDVVIYEKNENGEVIELINGKLIEKENSNKTRKEN